MSPDTLLMVANVVCSTLTVVLAVMAVKSVPVGRVFLVHRFGRYHRTMEPGYRFLIPLVEKVAHRVDTRLRDFPIAPLSVTTRDRGRIRVEISLYVQVVDPLKSVYGIDDHARALERQAHQAVRVLLEPRDQETALAARTEIGSTVVEELTALAESLGIRIDRVLVNPSVEVPAVGSGSLGQQPAQLAAGSVGRSEQPATPAPAPGPVGPPAPDGVGHRPLAGDDPRRIGGYHLLRRLGEGGMGTVFLGQSTDGRLVAVKVIRGQFVADAMFRRRFTREVETARRVSGEHTAALVDADPVGDPPWLVTEYIPGPSLHQVISRQGALPAPTLYMIAQGVAEALQGIHGSGIVHRDLKPSNIIVSEAGPRVIDFGIARAADSSALTRTGHLVGTPGFLAPEQLTGGTITSATDVYAYGMVMCHAGGVAPLPDGQPIESALGMLPTGLRDLVHSCLAPDPAARPEVAHILERVAAPAAATVDAWLPPPVRTMIDLHAAATVVEPQAR